jgi:hypothetical protein
LRQHIGTACGHVGLGGRRGLECAGAMQHMVGINGGDVGHIVVAAGADGKAWNLKLI